MRKLVFYVFGLFCIVVSIIFWNNNNRGVATWGFFFLGLMFVILAGTIFRTTQSRSGEIKSEPVITQKGIIIIFVVLCVVSMAIFLSIGMNGTAGLIATVLLVFFAHIIDFQKAGNQAMKLFKRH